MDGLQQRRAPGPGEVVGQLLGEARALVADFAELAVLDGRRAAIRLAWLLAAVLVLAVLVATTWVALIAAGIVLALGQGASWAGAIALAAGLNLLGAAALGWWTFTLIKEQPFTALLRQLRGLPPDAPQ